MTEIMFNTDTMRDSSDESLIKARDFMTKFEQLRDALENCTITGPVYDSAVAALNEKQEFVDEIRKTLNDNADYIDEKATKGDQLIATVSSEMR